MNGLVVVLLIILVFLIAQERENYNPVTPIKVNMGSKPQLSGKEEDVAIPADFIAELLTKIQEHIKAETGLCMSPVQTIYVDKYSGDFYDVRVMFYSPEHHFSSEISAIFRDGELAWASSPQPIADAPEIPENTPSPFLTIEESLKMN